MSNRLPFAVALSLAAVVVVAPASAVAEQALPPPPPPTPSAAAPAAAAPSSGGGGAGGARAAASSSDDGNYGPHAGWIGISLGLPAGGAPTAGITYFVSDTGALKLDLGLDVGTKNKKFTPGFSAEFGYRIYIAKAGNLSPFLQPGAFVAKAADGASFGDSFAMQFNFGLGAEYFFSDHLSVSGQTGVGLAFRDKFETIAFTTGTSGIYGNLYW